ncbi:MAG TPA: ATP-binding protein [Nannocystis sp.]
MLAPLGRDAAVVGQLLAGAGIVSTVVRDASALITRLANDVGAVLVTEEALTHDGATGLATALQAQPSWSDVPVLLFATGDRQDTAWQSEILRAAGNITVLERPIAGLTLVTAVQSALRARRRQYELRDVLASEQRARLAAEAATRIKDEFLANVSHELRTPLSAILLWGNLLGSGRAGQDDALSAIERSAQAQSKLIEDLLDVSRMLAGKLRVRLRQGQLAPVARAAVEVVQPMAEAKGVRLAAHIDPGAGTVLIDPDRMQQVLWNLLSNALKFTPTGGEVMIRLSRLGGQVRVRVSDTGIGIGAEFMPHLFERFGQADTTSTRSKGGLGLGLAIARQLVELHGGTLRADSRGEGQGAHFTVDLPVLRADAEVAGPDATSGPLRVLPGLRVLLVEDEPDTRRALALVLESAGAEVTAVDSAAAARAVLASLTAARRPGVLVSDIGLPGEDGIMLIRAIRAEEARLGETPFPALAVSAYSSEAAREQALAAGFDRYLVKPILPDALVVAILALAPPQPLLPPLSPLSPLPPLPPLSDA